MKPKGKFISNNNILDKIWEISRTTLMCTMLDAYVDNSWREQAQWFGDGVGSFMASVYLFGDTKLFKRCLRQWSQLQLSDGSLYSLGPMDYTWHLNIVGNNFFWINGLREYYMYTGDKDLVKELSCTLKSLVNWTEINTTRDGLFLQPEGYQNFIDWTEIQTRPYSLTLNLSLLWGLKDAEYLFNELNEIEYSHKVKKMASILKKIIENRFWNNRIGAWREWVKPCKDIWEDFLNRNQPGGWANMGPYKDVSFECSQHGNALSLLLDLGNDDQKKKVKAFVQRSLEIGQTFTNTMSPSWFARVVASLFYYGDNKNAIKAIRDWYGREIDYGVTTWPEQFAIKDSEKIDVPACGNCGQAIGSSVVCLFSRYILGCYPLIPGWKEFEFYPKFGDLGKVEGIIPTIKGNIIINWEKEGNKINTIIKIPPGIKGRTRVKKKDVELLPGENKIVFVQD